MNRRQMLKGAAAASLAGLSASCKFSSTSSPSQAPAGATPTGSSARSTGIRVLFYGLWAFWYGQPSPADGTDGVLAFSPDVTVHPAHAYSAKFKKSSSEITLEAGMKYWIVPDASSGQTQGSLWNKVQQQHDAGLFLHTNSGGSLVVAPILPDEMRRKNARTIWLPYPDDIVPVATIDLRKQHLFKASQDLSNADLRQRWPMIQAFSYDNSSSLALKDGVSTVTSSVNLHIITRPVPVPHDHGRHVGMAWKALTDLVPKQGQHPLEISFDYPLPENMGVCSDQVAGVDNDDYIPPACTKGASPSARSAGVGTEKVAIVVNPSNCAGGNGLQIGP